MKANIDAWHDEMTGEGLDHIVINTSGCGTVIKDYGHIFRNDPAYGEKAGQVAAIARDLTEVVSALGIPEALKPASPLGKFRVAYHDACSLQHGQKTRQPPRALLRDAGFDVAEIAEGHLCCGSAGTYNALKPGIAAEMGRQKAEHIDQLAPDAVAAGNIGCIEQIARYCDAPVVHTVELLDWATGGPRPSGLD